jgi:glycosyltransferase involved in cell wall biosynthesis
VILDTQIKQYRRRFLLALAERLRAHNITLEIAYSDPAPSERARADAVDLDGIGVKVPARWLLGERIMLQHAWPVVRDADLVIMEQSNKLVFNFVLLALSQLGRKRVAYWGHGYNRQETTPGLSEALKRKLLRQVDWWFAYTDGVASYLVEQGVPAETITTVHNTIDTSELTDALARLSPAARHATRRRFGIAQDAQVGLYCGALTPAKELDFLIAAAERISYQVPGFELVILGDGVSRSFVEAAAAQYGFVHYVGSCFGAARAEYFAIAEVFLLPALVGLAAVDAFAGGLPLFTTSLPTHGPEIEYVVDGKNGVITAHTELAFAASVAATLRDPARLARMRSAARDTAARLSLSNMIAAFEAGIVGCLGIEPAVASR